jgi:hypothetical protein
MNQLGKKYWMIILLSIVITSGCKSVEGESNNTKNTGDEDLINVENTIFTEELGEYYLYGITLGDSKSEVIERLGENYKDVFDPETNGSGADSILEYNNLSVHLFEDKVFLISIPRMDEGYYEKTFNEYDGDKFVDWQDKEDKYSLSYARFFYSEETSHILMAKYDPKKNLYVSLLYKDINFDETLNSPFLERSLD